MTAPQVSLEQPVRGSYFIARRWNRVAVGIALLTGLVAVLAPLGTSTSANSSGIHTSSRVSLLANEGPSVLIIAAIPVVLVAFPLVLRGGRASYRARVVIVVLLTVLVLLGAMSIGMFFIPTLVAMIASMSAQSRTYDRGRVDSDTPAS